MSETLTRCPFLESCGPSVQESLEELAADPKWAGAYVWLYPCGRCQRKKIINLSVPAWSDGYD